MIKKKTKTKPLPRGIVSTESAVAKAFSVATRTIQRWKLDGMPVEPKGNYDLIKITSWHLKRKQEKNPDDKNKTKHEAEYRKYRALLSKLEYQKATGEVLFKKEVEEVWTETHMEIKRVILDLPHKVSPQLEGLEVLEIRAILSERCNEIIKRLGRADFSETD